MNTSRNQLYSGSLVELSTSQGDIKCIVIGFKGGLVALATVDTSSTQDLISALRCESKHLREIKGEGRTTYFHPSILRRTGYLGYNAEKMDGMAREARRSMAPHHKKCDTIEHLGAYKCMTDSLHFTKNRFYWAFSGYNDEECWEDDLWLYDDIGARHSVSDRFLSLHFKKEYLQDKSLFIKLHQVLQINKHL